MQNYNNHHQMVPEYHYLLTLIDVALLIASIVYLVQAIKHHQSIFAPIMFVGIMVSIGISFWLMRSFPLRAQDRAIRAEENLRHFVLTGKLLDPRLHIHQITALRFAQDAEFLELAKKSAEQNTDPKEIKKSIKNWRADLYRV